MANVNGSDELKLIVLDYLRGDSINVIRVRLQTACVDMSCKDLYKSVRLQNSDDDDLSAGDEDDAPADDIYIEAILRSLNISSEEYQKLLGELQPPNLYNLLTHLYHSGNNHVGYLLNLIENIAPPSNWSIVFLLGAFFSAVAALIYQINRVFF